MNPREYIKNVLITEARDFTPLQERFSLVRNIRLLHGVIGLSSELAEVREVIRAETIDPIHLKEEMGDFLWYMGIMVDELQLDPDMVFVNTRDDSFGLDLDPTTKSLALHVYTDDMTIAVGTAVDFLKKHLMYGQELQVEKIKEELQKTDYLIGMILNMYGMTTAEARETNIAKLKFRYQEKFTEAAALNRDLTTERQILEKGN